MRINESSIGSVIRVFAGVLLLSLGFGGELRGVLAIVADILGTILLLTGVVGFCPLYVLFKFKSLKNKSLCEECWYYHAIVPISVWNRNFFLHDLNKIRVR